MATVANVKRSNDSHWYYIDGKPCYELPKADGKGMKSPTLADARKLNLAPSVTTILKILDKPALRDWLIEQAVLAVLTTPKKPGEADDQFVKRVLQVERVQDQESQVARDMGSEIHDALEKLFSGNPVSDELKPFVMPAYTEIIKRGKMVSLELPVAGRGYGGRLDAVQDQGEILMLWDWKTTKKLPDPAKGGSWSEHRLQLSAYAKAYHTKNKDADLLKGKRIRTGNVYISSIDPGKFVICEHPDNEWIITFSEGFFPLLIHWQWMNDYRPDYAAYGNQ